jgi:hypothetical protein
MEELKKAFGKVTDAYYELLMNVGSQRLAREYGEKCLQLALKRVEKEQGKALDD